ncbi:hypothetical protein [Curtobacterium sp. P97]|uniref:hypothetical protein n=1 Tax=Curtobacterium sp. P97 TaxID=2939562 RepID=UPI00204161FC|nr:hypothetical protein [Curtobacterium sp. P97]MCM3521502.1 hypothetical protein [Curtobacterium sp. P97]
MSDSINTWGGTEAKADGEPLFVVQRPRFPQQILIVLGGAAVVFGLLGTVIEQLVVSGADSTAFVLIGLVGALFLLIGLALAAGRVTVFDRHYLVKSGFGKARRREVDDIHVLRYGTQSAGGGPTFISLTAWNDRKKKQFTVFTNFRGYDEFTAWLAERRPEQWTECERLGLPE